MAAIVHPKPNQDSLPKPSQTITEAQLGRAKKTEGTTQPPQPTDLASPYQELRIWSEMFNDAMIARISASNRSERGGVHSDLYANHIKHLEQTEHDCSLELVRTFRKTVTPSVRAWQKASPGIGEHLLARLLGVIGDPCLATPYHWEGGGETRRLVADEPFRRSISQLWSYCGVGDPERRRKKGQTAEEAMAAGIPLAKSILYLLAQSCVKAEGGEYVPATGRYKGRTIVVARSPYRDVYDKARAQYADREHAKLCPACGPKGKPAKVGSPWSAAHQHAAALRKVSKEILRDLWIAANAGT